jgi:hypothetical protein
MIIYEDLNEIINLCNKLKGHPEISKWNENRAYKILLILKQEFEDELKQIENGEIIPF